MNLETLWTIAGVGLIIWISMVVIGIVVGIYALIRFKKHDEELERKRKKFDDEFEDTRKEIERGARAPLKRFRL